MHAPFPHRPLAGRRIVVTRARSQAGALGEWLLALGAEVIYFPTIRVERVVEPGRLAALGRALDDYDWLLFTSANAVEHFEPALREPMGRARARARVCAIGPATAARLKQAGVVVDLIPDDHLGDAVAPALVAAGVGPGCRVLFPHAAEVRPELPAALRAAGVELDEVVVYRTVRDGEGFAAVAAALRGGDVDAVTFTSSSTARAFVELVGRDLGAARAASIGPVTSGTLRELGIHVAVEASPSTVEGLVDALVETLGGRS